MSLVVNFPDAVRRVALWAYSAGGFRIHARRASPRLLYCVFFHVSDQQQRTHLHFLSLIVYDPGDVLELKLTVGVIAGFLLSCL